MKLKANRGLGGCRAIMGGVFAALTFILNPVAASEQKLTWSLPDGQQGEMTTLGRAFVQTEPDFIAAAARIVLDGEPSTDEEMMQATSREFCNQHSEMLVGFLKASNNPEWNSVEFNHFMVALTWDVSSFAFDQRREVFRTVMSYPECEIQMPSE